MDSYRATAHARAVDAPVLLDPVLATARAKGGPVASVLELGCADGVFTSWLAREGLTVTAVEYSARMRCATRHRLRSDAAPLERVKMIGHEFHNGGEPLPPLRGRVFDVVIAMAFVHLFPAGTDLKVLQQIGRHLAPGGVAFLTTTVEEEDRRGFEFKDGPHGSRVRYRSRYTATSFIELVNAAGLEVRDKQYQVDPRVEGKTWLDVIVGHPGDSPRPAPSRPGASLREPAIDGGA
ncbi:class I SAM-dependent methyltransferase [Myceligenerans xiligouense]|uniref:Methyltransferase family protein n=1 Tax=Myceligenerans xiligouense TaxID=253184 RepID=A0A3N4YMD4_9MICO|nr:class I SAM-dependent methyltransferase [Myceligenerans xiligouense]RPF21277.1 methyltransferase family protein [Myceligenerans xiligouense]